MRCAVRIYIWFMEVVWFKRDLRITDHAPLYEAAKRGPVLPLYIVEPQLWAQPDQSRRHFDFLSDSVADLQAHFGLAVFVGKANDALPFGGLFVVPNARTPWGDAAFGADVGHLGVNQASAAFGQCAVVHQVPITRCTVDRFVLRHRRDHDSILDFHVAKPKRCQHR